MTVAKTASLIDCDVLYITNLEEPLRNVDSNRILRYEYTRSNRTVTQVVSWNVDAQVIIVLQLLLNKIFSEKEVCDRICLFLKVSC